MFLDNLIMAKRMISFKVIKNCRGNINENNLKRVETDFCLEENGWNDYDYYCSFLIHATKRITGDKNEYIGSVRIMQKGQQKKLQHVLSDTVGYDKPFQSLPDDFVSLSFDENLYEWLEKRPYMERINFIEQLHMIIGESQYYDIVKDDPCFNKSLLRDSTMNNYIFKKIRKWIYSEEIRYDLRKETFDIKFDNCDESIKLNFSCIPDIDSSLVPNGIVAFIGSNGSGKSTAMYKLAKLMYLFPEQRHMLKKSCGKLIPNDLGVERMILISYSPFDNFILPSKECFESLEEGNIRLEDINDRFIYCGIRDINKENESHLGIHNSSDLKLLRQESTFLKTQSSLSEEFANAILNVIKNDLKYSLWEEITKETENIDSKLHELLLEMDYVSDCRDMFKQLSTGYKYIIHSFAYVLSYIEEGSLILFDEPENHIHPPLLSFLMAQYRKILAKFKSVMFVSTHSPVIIQELFAKNVYKVYQDGDKISVKKPMIETYGATFGEINSEVFGLTTDVSKYFDTIDFLYDKWEMDNEESADAMLDKFESKMSGQLSDQIESYLIDKFYENNPTKD